MRLALLSGRVRIVDALVVAASALLGLKAAVFLLSPAEPELAADGLPSFARVLSYARTNYIPPDPTTTGSLPAAAPAPAPAAPKAEADPPEAAPPGSSSERVIRERLAERREELRGKSTELDARERLIQEVERRLDAEAAERRAAEERRADPATVAAADAETAALKGVVVMYETMKPKEAARIFDRLPQDVLVPVVRRINPRKMAEILAAMTPETAERLTIALARRDRPESEERATGLPPGELPAIEPERPSRGRAPTRPSG